MKINLAKSAGFCFGVKRAIEIALKTSAGSKKIYMLGDIVHNERVVKDITDSGIIKIKTLGSGKGKTLLLRAHGAGMATVKKAKELGYEIIDATCPMVKEIHKIAQRMEKLHCKIIVIGDKKHDEVLGIVGQLKTKALIIENLDSVPIDKIKKIKKACVIVQSTQNFEKVLKIVEVLRKYIPDIKFFNTICHPTRLKQEEIKKMPLVNDLMLIIGSKDSANTKRLFEISKSLNKRSFWIDSKGELKTFWFRNIKTVGLTAGASTPQSTIQEIISSVKKISR